MPFSTAVVGEIRARIDLQPLRESVREIHVGDVLGTGKMQVAGNAPFADRRQGFADEPHRHRREDEIRKRLYHLTALPGGEPGRQGRRVPIQDLRKAHDIEPIHAQ